MTSRREYEEKRNFIRMKVEAPVHITLTEGNRTLQGVCRNLSGAGMLAEVTEQLSLGSVVLVHIPPADNKTVSFRAEGVVARVDELEQGYMLGININQVLD